MNNKSASTRSADIRLSEVLPEPVKQRLMQCLQNFEICLSIAALVAAEVLNGMSLNGGIITSS